MNVSILVESTRAKNIEYSLGYLAPDFYRCLYMFCVFFCDCDIHYVYVIFVVIEYDLSIYLYMFMIYLYWHEYEDHLSRIFIQ